MVTLIRISKIITVTVLMNSFLLLSLGLLSLTARSNPVIFENTKDIVFDPSCPNGEKVCAGHPIDCLGGCALNTTTGATIFKWQRTIFEQRTGDTLPNDIQGMKDCINRDAVHTALLAAMNGTQDTSSLLAAMNDTQDNGSPKLPCTVDGSVWHNIYPKYSISAFTKPTCDAAKSYLDELTTSCQDWKNSLSKVGEWVGYGFAALSFIMTGYFVTAEIGRCTGRWHWFTIGDLVGRCYATCRCYSGYTRMN